MKRPYWQPLSVLLIALFLVASGASLVSAAGIAVTEKSVKGLGSAFAGGAAAAEDASTIYFNPAGMTRLTGTQVDVGASVIAYSFEPTNMGSATAIPGVPLSGGDGGDGGMTKVIPLAFYSQSISDKLKVGLGITFPFGLGTEYDANWVGRYHTIKSEVLTVDINPSLAYRIDSIWSVGVGVSAQYVDAELTNAIDYGTAAYASPLIPPSPPAAPIAPFIPQQLDGDAKLSADDWGYGFNLGVLCELSEGTRLGLSYRSKISYDLEGQADFTTPAAATAVAISQGLVDTAGSAEIDMPGSLSVSAYHQLDDKWALMADVTWTNWEVLDELRVKLASGALDNVTTFEWEDSVRVAAGVTYAHDDQWTFRGGFAYDPTPVPNAQRRTPRVPDADRYWVSLGSSVRLSEQVGLDFAYTYLTADETSINKTATGEDQLRGALKLDLEGSSHIVAVQLSWSL